MSCLKFKIPLGYTVTKKESVVDIDDAVEILSSRKRRKYVSAHRTGYDSYAKLRSDIWKCPYCNYEYPATFMDNQTHRFGVYHNSDVRMNKGIVEKWGSRQISLFGNEWEDLMFTPSPVITGEWKCPKCSKKSSESTGEREVCIEYDDLRVRIKAEICEIAELLSLPWIVGGTITIQFPIYEVLTFNFKTGKTYVELQGSDDLSVAKRDITSHPSVWEKGVVYQLISDNVVVARVIKRIFANMFGGIIPFAKDEQTPEKYILMTRFIGFPRRFYDAIPYARGTYQIEETFKKIADKIHRAEDALVMFENAEIPKCKSIKKIFLTEAGLLFYLDECEKLWGVIGDINYYRHLLKSENIFGILSLLHQRPVLFNLVFDYCRVKGAKAVIEMLMYNWTVSINYALDYCTMNDTMKLSEQEKWKQQLPKHRRRYDHYDDDYDDEDEDEMDYEYYYQRINRKIMFSVPMRRPHESIENCVIDEFSFSWLRCGNDYFIVGNALKNCLSGWDTTDNPVVAVRRGGRIVAAIEVGPRGVNQVLGYHNTSITRVEGLPEVYQKWLDKNKLKDLRCYTHNELPF